VIWLEYQKRMLDCAEWLDIVIDAMVKSCRFVPKCVFARRLARVALDKKTESATLPQLWEEINIGDHRVSYPPGNGQEFFLKPPAIVVAKNEDQGGLKL
jgi:hypothetical protein